MDLSGLAHIFSEQITRENYKHVIPRTHLYQLFNFVSVWCWCLARLLIYSALSDAEPSVVHPSVVRPSSVLPSTFSYQINPRKFYMIFLIFDLNVHIEFVIRILMLCFYFCHWIFMINNRSKLNCWRFWPFSQHKYIPRTWNLLTRTFKIFSDLCKFPPPVSFCPE